MKPLWLIEDFLGERDHGNGYRELIDEAKRQDFRVIVLDITNHFDLKPGKIETNECVVFQGSIQLFKKLKAELPVFPLGWMTDKNYLCTTYYPKFQQHLFNDIHVFTTIAGLKHNKWRIYSAFAKEATIFVRPDSGNKTFTGGILDLQDFDKLWSDHIHYGAKDDELVVVSTPKIIKGEWRYICTKWKEILGVSLYKYNDQRTYIPSAPIKASELCKEILEVGWYPDPVFTVDIAEDNDGNFWLMEFNSFTSAGTYASVKEPIVRRVSEIALAEWEEVKRINT